MGLDTTHGCWNGPYSAFNRWRDRVAVVAGYKIVDFDGMSAPDIDWEQITDENVRGLWAKLPSDPLLILIVHSDCDGYIQYRYAKALADRLAELLPLLEGYDKEKAQKFIDGLLLAHSRQERIDFS